MSLNKQIYFGVGVSWLGRIITISANLLLIPIMFHHLGKEELGLWFLLYGSQGLIGLLNMGIPPIITRRIALAKGKSGTGIEVELTDASKKEIGDLAIIGKTILRTIGLAAFVISSFIGYCFINQLEIVEVPRQTVIYSWVILCAGYSISVWVEYLNCLLTGFGYVGFNNLILTFVSFVTTIINIIVVILGGGLLELSIIFVVTNLIQRCLLVVFIKKYKGHLLNFKGEWSTNTAKSLVKPAFDYWLKSLGTYLILRSDQYFIGTFIGVSAIASYNATYQLVSNLRTLAVAFSQSSIPFISQLWKAGEITNVHKIVKKICLSALLIVSVGTSFLLVSGSNLIQLWIGKDSFVGYEILVVFCLMIFFDTQNVCLIECARATGKDKYGLMSILAGGLNIVLTLILIKPLGLLGVCLATLISLMLTENWYALYEPLSRLKISLGQYAKEIVLPITGVFVVNYAVGLLVNLSLGSWDNQLLPIFFTALSSLLIFLWMAYQLVLSKT